MLEGDAEDVLPPAAALLGLLPVEPLRYIGPLVTSMDADEAAQLIVLLLRPVHLVTGRAFPLVTHVFRHGLCIDSKQARTLPVCPSTFARSTLSHARGNRLALTQTLVNVSTHTHTHIHTHTHTSTHTLYLSLCSAGLPLPMFTAL